MQGSYPLSINSCLVPVNCSLFESFILLADLQFTLWNFLVFLFNIYVFVCLLSEFDKLVNDFNNYSNSYSYSYTIVNYLLKNYEHEKILDLIRDDYKLIKESNKIFYEVRNNQ